MLTKRNLIAGLLAITLLAPQLQGQDTAPKPSYTLIKNVKIFDGVNDRLKPGHVLIENNLIKQVGDIKTLPEGVKVIDGKGKTLMPGMHDQHMHMSMYVPLAVMRDDMTQMHVGAVSILRCEQVLMKRVHYHPRCGRSLEVPDAGH